MIMENLEAKFILVGGYPHKAKDGGKAMCKDAINGFSEPVQILICLFARPKKQWKKLFENNKQFFIKNLSNTKLFFTLADEKNFIGQIMENDLIYFSGGDPTSLVEILERFPEWMKKLNGKNVMGSSAGVDILSKYHYDIKSCKCSDGYGLVPVKTIVHYKAENYTPPTGWQAAYKELQLYKEDLPIWALGEGEYKTLEVK